MAQKNVTHARAVSRSGGEVWGRVLPFVLSALLFLVICLCSASTVKPMALGLSALLLLSLIPRFSALRERITLPVLALALYVFMDGLSTLYAAAGKFALYEFLKVLCAFCLALVLLAFAPGQGEQPGRWLAGLVEGACAWAGLVSIDMLSTRLLSGAVFALLGLFTGDYGESTAVEAGVRMISIFGNPNVFAGGMGLGVLLSLGLCVSARDRWERGVHAVLLYLNSLAFVLAFSMGASASIALGFVTLLIFETSQRRGGLLVLMLEALLFTVPASALISLTSFQGQDRFQPVPLLCALVGAGALCLTEEHLGQKLGSRLAGKSKPIFLLLGGMVLCLLLYILAAWNLTGGESLQSGEQLRRAAYPAPGTYVLEVEASAPAGISIESQNRQETMMHTSTLLYQGEVSQASFTVPEDSLVVYFNFAASEPVRLESAAYRGEAGEGKIPLGYYLLPGFIANRLQGLFANENAIQRTVFFDDGLKLFRRSPIIGMGMGAFESAFKSVQTFFYETRYTHNHYIQALVETGVVGLILFLTLLGTCGAATFLAHRAPQAHPLLPACAAALVFMAAHAVTEVVFSYYSYLPLAYAVFVLIGLCCGDALRGKWSEKRFRTVSLCVISVLVCAYSVLLIGNLWARHIVEEEATLASLDSAISLDRFEWADYAVSYVRACGGEDIKPTYRRKADAYAQRLSRVNSNIVPFYLAEYYFQTGREEEAFRMLQKYTAFVASDNETWENTFQLLRQYESGEETYRQGVLALAEQMERWNLENLGEITLSEEAQALLDRMRA